MIPTTAIPRTTLPVALTVTPSSISGDPPIIKVHFNRMALRLTTGCWDFIGILPDTTLDDLDSIEANQTVDLSVTFILEFDLPPEIDFQENDETDHPMALEDDDENDDEGTTTTVHTMEWVVPMKVNVAGIHHSDSEMKIFGTVGINTHVMNLVTRGRELAINKIEEPSQAAA
jgi:hypothetical protein